MQTESRRLKEAELVLLISKLSDEQKLELIYFMEWLKASKRTDDEVNAEMERRQANR